LIGNAWNSEIAPSWEREHSQKTPVWEQVHQTIFEYSCLGN